MEKRVVKIALIGDSGCGKTSMCEMYINESFESNIAPTLGINRFSCDAETETNQYIINIFDCEGGSDSSVIKKCVNEADGIIIVFNMNDKSTIVSIDKYMEIVSGKSVIIFGNKKDLLTDFDSSLLEKYEKIPKFYGSAKSGEEVDTAFGEIVSINELNWKTVCDQTQNNGENIKSNSEPQSSDSAKSSCCILV